MTRRTGASHHGKKRATQLTLFSRSYRVRAAGCDVVVQAQTRSEARYGAFKLWLLGLSC